MKYIESQIEIEISKRGEINKSLNLVRMVLFTGIN